MRIYKDLSEDIRIKKPIVTVGSFDGVHLAHLAIISLLNERAAMCGGESVLVTFAPHPRMVLNNDKEFRKNFRLLTTEKEKIERLEKAGLQNLVILPFDKNFAKTPFPNFIYDVLVEKIGVHRMVIGFNHSFGKDRHGGYEQMLESGKKYGFEVERFDEQLVADKRISSSQIRTHLWNGDIKEANKLLDYNFCVNGILRADIFIPDSKVKLIPAKGHYLTKVRLNTKIHYAICDIADDIRFPDLHFLSEGDKIMVKFIKRVEL